MTLESKVEEKLRESVKRVGGLCIKLPAILYRGIPDRLVLLPGGRVWFLELKKVGGRTSEHQVRFRKILLRLGMNHGIIEGMDELEQWVLENV